MSTVKADNFTWKTGEATAQVGSSVTGPQIVYGVAKSWCNINGNSPYTLRASFNVSSLTRNAVADYSITFTNAFVDTNYTPVATVGGGGTFACLMHCNNAGTEVAPTTSSCRFETQNNTQVLDTKYINVIVNR